MQRSELYLLISIVIHQIVKCVVILEALQRELENAYKQVKMYKQQVELLKVKEESS